MRHDSDDYIEENDTFMALMRKLEDGMFANEAGAKVQALLAELRAIAAKKGGNAIGEITLKIKVPVMKDGYAMPVASLKCKAPEMRREESMIFIGEDGDLMARPVEKQTVMKGIDGGAAKSPAVASSKSM